MFRPRRAEAKLLFFALLISVGCHLLVQFADSDTLPADTGTLAMWMTGLYLSAHLTVRRLAPNASPLLLPIAGVLTGIGYAMVSRLDGTNDRIEGVSVAQGMWIVLGIGAFIATLFFLRDYRILDRYRYITGLAGITLLLLPIVPFLGRTVNGARLWTRIGPLQFQPGEGAKILLVVFFASFLMERRELLAVNTGKIGPIHIPDFKHLGPILAVWGLSLGIMLFEKDLGSSLLIFSIFLSMLYIATSRTAFVTGGLALFSVGALAAYQTFNHVQIRIKGWLDPLNPDTVENETYQLAQSLFAFASGGIDGSGPGQGSPWRIPFAETDFIFASIGEELGLLGSIALILLYLVLVTTGFRTALRCSDTFGKLLAAGLSVALAIQTFVIVGGVTRLIPLTGITLPFVSYGGSSIVSNFVILAILVVVSDQQISGPRGHTSFFRRKALEIGEKIPDALPDPVGGST